MYHRSGAYCAWSRRLIKISKQGKRGGLRTAPSPINREKGKEYENYYCKRN
nr:MAG TPA: hypothetical protein [Caudoviricetes sp.]DAZ71764.1 MAG TPA: hypothetical protein [Caudoviricetes sp.]